MITWINSSSQFMCTDADYMVASVNGKEGLFGDRLGYAMSSRRPILEEIATTARPWKAGQLRFDLRTTPGTYKMIVYSASPSTEIYPDPSWVALGMKSIKSYLEALNAYVRVGIYLPEGPTHGELTPEFVRSAEAILWMAESLDRCSFRIYGRGFSRETISRSIGALNRPQSV